MRASVLVLLPLLPGVLCACNPPRAEGENSYFSEDLARRRRDLSMPVAPRDLRQADIHVVLTADNAYTFGWGDANQVNTVMARPKARLAADIFNCPVGNGPEAYDVPAEQAPESAYLYIIAWADNATTQGVIGQFLRNEVPLYTGDGNWEVCATGVDHDPATSDGPTREAINAEIARCSAGIGDKATTSAGWVSTTGPVTPGAVGTLAVGEDNSAQAGDFPIVCQKDAAGLRGVDAAARWIWYSPDGKSPFRYTGGVNPTRDFLIFRLPAVILG